MQTKEQHNATTRRHYQKHKEYYYNKNVKRKNEIKIFISSLKNVPCKDCGLRYPPYVMDFDHKRDKEFNVAEMVRRQCSNIKILKEVEKCDLVCANCHRIRTHERYCGVV